MLILNASALKPDHGCPEGLIHQDLFYGRALAHVALVERLQYPP